MKNIRPLINTFAYKDTRGGIIMKKRTLFSAVAISIGMLASSQSNAKSSAGDDWQFSLAPLFLWGMSMNGTSQVGPTTTPLNLDFQDDILENMEAVLTLHFEARKNKLTLFAEYQYVDLGPSTVLPTGDQVDVGFKNTMAELGIAYTLSKSAKTDW